MMTKPLKAAASPVVLVCEDEPIHARLVTRGLERRGLTVLGPCASAADAARLAADDRLSAALLDVSLDGGTVADAASVLAARNIPFAFITGYGPETAALLGHFPNALAVPKPIDLETLDIILDDLLETANKAVPAAAN